MMDGAARACDCWWWWGACCCWWWLAWAWCAGTLWWSAPRGPYAADTGAWENELWALAL